MLGVHLLCAVQEEDFLETIVLKATTSKYHAYCGMIVVKNAQALSYLGRHNYTVGIFNT